MFLSGDLETNARSPIMQHNTAEFGGWYEQNIQQC